MQTDQIFVWYYIDRKLVFFSKISIIISDINSVLTTPCSEKRSIFQDFWPKQDVTFSEKSDTAHSYIKQEVSLKKIIVGANGVLLS